MRIPIAVEQDDCICGREIDPQAACASRQQENECVLTVVVESVDVSCDRQSSCTLLENKTDVCIWYVCTYVDGLRVLWIHRSARKNSFYECIRRICHNYQSF